MKHVLDLLGRIFIALIFLFEAYDSIWFFDETKTKMTEYGLTWRQDLLLYSAIFLLLMGGILVLIGYRVKLGAFMLLAYWIPVTFIVHSFWNDPEDIRRIQSVMFMRNLGIVGGLLFVYVNGSGKYSIRRLFATSKVPGT
ncbi:MAG: DoxX family protein [Bacteroidota bacterium]